MKKQFERGIEYERLRRENSFHLFLGYSCIFGSVALIFSNSNFKIGSSIFLAILGLIALLAGYEERKELKLLEKKK